jgi:hypothetical protein
MSAHPAAAWHAEAVSDRNEHVRDAELLSRPQRARLPRYAEATYLAVTQQGRRQAAVALGVVLVFGIVTLVAGMRWAALRTEITELPDDPLIEAFGVRIPDPRPAIERTELRIRAFAWGMVAMTSLVLSLLAFGIYLLVRPTPLRAIAPTDRAPPRDKTGPSADG